MTAALLLSLPIFAHFSTHKRALILPGKAAKVTITERQQTILRSLRDSATVAVRLQQRATIILLAFDGLPNEDIAVQVGLERHQVGIWRRRGPKPLTASSRSNAARTPRPCDVPSSGFSPMSTAPAPPAPSPPSKSLRSSPWPANPRKNPVAPSPTGPTPNWPTKWSDENCPFDLRVPGGPLLASSPVEAA